MKKILKSLFALFFFAAFANNLLAQSEVIQRFEQLINNRNAKAMVKEFTESIELNMEGNRQTASRTESENLLAGFFAKYPLVKFTYEHKGAVGNSSYAIGVYNYAGGNFRVVVKTEGDQIKKLEFTKD